MGQSIDDLLFFFLSNRANCNRTKTVAYQKGEDIPCVTFDTPIESFNDNNVVSSEEIIKCEMEVDESLIIENTESDSLMNSSDPVKIYDEGDFTKKQLIFENQNVMSIWECNSCNVSFPADSEQINIHK